jgi:hypothetical protein
LRVNLERENEKFHIISLLKHLAVRPRRLGPKRRKRWEWRKRKGRRKEREKKSESESERERDLPPQILG